MRSPAIPQPVGLPCRLTEQDKTINACRTAGETRKAIAEALGISPGEVQRAEWRIRAEKTAQCYFAEEGADSLSGLAWCGVLSSNAASAMSCHHWHHEGRGPRRLSEVAALGRHYVSRMHGIGPKALGSIERAMSLLGIAWSPVDRTPKPKPPETPQARKPEPTIDPAILAEVVLRVEKLERTAGIDCIFRDNPERNTFEYVRARLHYLTGYICGDQRLSPNDTLRQRCTTIEQRAKSKWGERSEIPAEDLETSGNLICFPGVNLRDVLQNGGAE